MSINSQIIIDFPIRTLEQNRPVENPYTMTMYFNVNFNDNSENKWEDII